MTSMDLGKVVGEKGVGIASIEKTGTSGLVDTYTITYTDESTSTFTVTNGSDGSSVSVTQVLSSGTKLATITVDGTSTDLYCNSGGSADIVTSWESTLSDTKVPSEKLTKETIDTKISKSNTAGLVKNDGTIDTTSYVSDVSGKEDTSNKVTSWSSTPTDTHYPSEKLTKDSLDGKQATLVSGTNIATINNQSLLNGGNITVSGGVSTGTFTELATAISDAITNNNGVLTLDKDYKYDSTTDSTYVKGVTLTANLTIHANGHIIDGNNTARVLQLSASSSTPLTLEINDLKIQNTYCSDSGGAIYANSYCTVTINNSQFTKCVCKYEGGAIDVKSNSKVYINNSDFLYCNTTNSNGGAVAVRTTSTSNITASNFTGNYGGYAGALYLYSNSTSDIQDCSFVLNKATQNNGGAIRVQDTCSIQINNSNFVKNHANRNGGGAIEIYDDSTGIVNNSVFEENSVGGKGGAIWINDGNSSLTVKDSVFKGNASNGNNNKGAVYIDTGCTLLMEGSIFNGNTASSYANIYASSATTVYNCTIDTIGTTCYNVTNYDDVSSENIVDNLTTSDATKVLSAKQGKALADLIGDAISYINQ